MMSEVKRTRVRYSRVDEKRSPKNTLYTFQEGENLYFGIARCNIKLDTFTRSIGTHIAEERAKRAKFDELQEKVEREKGDEFVSEYLTQSSLTLHSSGLRGLVSKSKVKELVQYFRSVDEHLLEQLNSSGSVEVS